MHLRSRSAAVAATPPPPTYWSAVCLGDYHGCALRAWDGSASCWGDHIVTYDYGQQTAPAGVFFSALATSYYHQEYSVAPTIVTFVLFGSTILVIAISSVLLLLSTSERKRLKLEKEREEKMAAQAEELAEQASALAEKEEKLAKYHEKEKATEAELDALKDELDEAKLLAVMKRAKVNWDDIIIEARIGAGAFGEVFKGRFKERRWR